MDSILLFGLGSIFNASPAQPLAFAGAGLILSGWLLVGCRVGCPAAICTAAGLPAGWLSCFASSPALYRCRWSGSGLLPLVGSVLLTSCRCQVMRGCGCACPRWWCWCAAGVAVLLSIATAGGWGAGSAGSSAVGVAAVRVSGWCRVAGRVSGFVCLPAGCPAVAVGCGAGLPACCRAGAAVGVLCFGWAGLLVCGASVLLAGWLLSCCVALVVLLVWFFPAVVLLAVGSNFRAKEIIKKQS